MKISYNEATARDCSTLEQDLVLCDNLGFDYIEIRLDMLEKYLEHHTINELADFFQGHRLKPHALNAIYLYQEMYSAWDDRKKRERLEKQFLDACEAGEKIGSRYIVIVPPLAEKIYMECFEKTKKDCVRILRHLSALAQPFGIYLCFETVGLSKSSVRSVSQAREIVEAVNEDNVGYVFDAFNLFSNGGESSFDEMELVQAEKIFAVHINNADHSSHEDMVQEKRRFCDEGVICLEHYLGVLKKIGYRGMVSIETFRPEYWRMEAEKVIRRAYQTTREVLEQNGCL